MKDSILLLIIGSTYFFAYVGASSNISYLQIICSILVISGVMLVGIFCPFDSEEFKQLMKR